MRKLLVLTLAAFLLAVFLKDHSVQPLPGVNAPGVPLQTSLSRDAFERKDYQITPLADFELTARVLSKKTYRFGREAVLSPVDLALGWGRMSDSSVLQAIRIRQSNRWYYWSTDNFPIPRREIETSSANMHMIPGNEQIRDQLMSITEGQTVKLEGYLVRVDADDGWHWVSSMTRNDTGQGACELVYVERLTIKQG